jgi:nicotinate-nucleotide adenylyltransferase
MRRVWFGGSFDPIHHGHLITARAVAESAGFDRVVLVPNNQSPLKLLATDRATPGDRLEMCRLAVTGDPLFEVDDLELRRDPPSYTCDTVVELGSKMNDRVTWLIGSDSVPNLPGWHRWQELLSVARFLVMGRPGDAVDWSALPPEVATLRSAVVPTPLIQISSTDIRQRVKAGRSVRNLVPPAVGEYIRRRGLYLPLPGSP